LSWDKLPVCPLNIFYWNIKLLGCQRTHSERAACNNNIRCACLPPAYPIRWKHLNACVVM
jgi:hypothetical protein